MPTYVAFRDLPAKVLLYYAQAESKPKGYIDASILGHLCERRIWLDWQGITPPLSLTQEERFKKGKTEEKLERGRQEAERLAKALQGSGCLITHRQARFAGLDGNLQGQINGMMHDANGNPYILAIKPLQDKRFKTLRTKGVPKAFAADYLQSQMAMHFLKIPRTLFLGVNQNNGEIYRAILNLDEDEIEMGLQRVHQIITYGKAMPAALGNPNGQPPPCQGCEFVKFCYHKKVSV